MSISPKAQRNAGGKVRGAKEQQLSGKSKIY